ncbi:unnamed protein product [Amoebophrya sp. A25]|nr:unnamed protein product [Amoebophrya sp. A25]|eukprot:GSA25T00006810001.1
MPSSTGSSVVPFERRRSEAVALLKGEKQRGDARALELHGALFALIARLEGWHKLGRDKAFPVYKEKEATQLFSGHLEKLVLFLRDFDFIWKEKMVNVIEKCRGHLDAWNYMEMQASQNFGGMLNLILSVAATPPTVEGEDDMPKCSTGGPISPAACSDSGSVSVDEFKKSSSFSSTAPRSAAPSHPVLNKLTELDTEFAEAAAVIYEINTWLMDGGMVVSRFRKVMAGLHDARSREVSHDQVMAEDEVVKEEEELNTYLAQNTAANIAGSALRSTPWLVFGIIGAAKITYDTYGQVAERQRAYSKLDKAKADAKQVADDLALLGENSKSLDDLLSDIQAQLYLYRDVWCSYVIHDFEKFRQGFIPLAKTVAEHVNASHLISFKLCDVNPPPPLSPTAPSPSAVVEQSLVEKKPAPVTSGGFSHTTAAEDKLAAMKAEAKKLKNANPFGRARKNTAAGSGECGGIKGRLSDSLGFFQKSQARFTESLQIWEHNRGRMR